MRYKIFDVPEGDETFWMLAIVTPTSRESQSRSGVEEVFRSVALEMESLVSRQQMIVSVWITLRSADGLGPASGFLPALCGFLRDYPFPVAGDRTLACPLRLSVDLASNVDHFDDEDADDDVVLVNQSDPIVEEATGQICGAFWDNERFRSTGSVSLDLPVAPTGGVLDRFFEARPVRGGGDPPLSVTVKLSDPSSRPTTLTDPRHGGPPPARDFIRLAWEAVVLMAEGRVHGANAAKHAMRSSFDYSSSALPLLHADVSSPGSAAAFIEGLTQYRNHSFQCISLCAGDPEELDITSSPPRHEGRDNGGPPPAIDGADLCGAVLRCPSVSGIEFEGFEFSASALAAAHDALLLPANSTAAVKWVFLTVCTFPDPAAGPVQLATAVSRNNQIQVLNYEGPFLRGTEMTSLCTALTGSVWDLEMLILEFKVCPHSFPGGDHHLEHFFRNLPSMKTLKLLAIRNELPANLSEIVVDSFKNNYWLLDVEDLALAGDPDLASRLRSEIESYVAANKKGRTAIYRAVSNPDDAQLQVEAMMVLRRLSNSDDLADATSLFLCLQLYLPSRFGGPRSRLLPSA